MIQHLNRKYKLMLRLMKYDDVDAVVQLEKRVQTHPWSNNQFSEAIKNYQCTIWEDSGRIVGFCILQPVLDEANLLLMAVEPKLQGRGIGYLLLTESISLLKNQPIQIFLEVRESNFAAIRLYEKAEFHQIDLRKNYYPKSDGGKEHAIIMVKTCSNDFHELFK